MFNNRKLELVLNACVVDRYLSTTALPDPTLLYPPKCIKQTKQKKWRFLSSNLNCAIFWKEIIWICITIFSKNNFVFVLFWFSSISSIWRVFRKRLDFDSPNIATLIWLSRNLSQRPFARFTSATRWMNDGMQEDKRLNKLMPKTPYHCRIGKL